MKKTIHSGGKAHLLYLSDLNGSEFGQYQYRYINPKTGKAWQAIRGNKIFNSHEEAEKYFESQINN